MPAVMAANLAGTVARMSEPDVAAWNEGCRLNPARGAGDHMDDPKVQEAFSSILSNMGPAMENVGRILA